MSIRSIFSSLDRGNFGELKPADFEKALTRIGIVFNKKEMQNRKAVLEPRDIGFIK